MGKSKKKRGCDIYISPGKSYLYKTRKTLFVLSDMTFIFNMLLMAVFDDSMRKTAVISILFSVLFAVIQLSDNRKANWTWFYVIILTAIFLIISAFAVFNAQLQFMTYLWAGELVFFCGFIVLSLRKENKG